MPLFHSFIGMVCLSLLTLVCLQMQVAVACCTLVGKQVVDNSPGDLLSSYVWDLQDPNTPEHVLMPSSLILSLHFSPKDPKVVYPYMWLSRR